MSGVAASYLANRQAAADPIGSFSAGVQLRSNLQKIDLAAQAGQMDTLLNIVKIQNQQADARIKEQLMKDQTQIDWYNAETNRINATRPRTTGGTAGGGGLGIIEHGDGSFSLPGMQMPSDGEGDGTEVPPPGTSSTVRVMPEGTPPGQQPTPAVASASHIPGLANGQAFLLGPQGGMTGAPQAQAQPAPQAEPQAAGADASLFPTGGSAQADPSFAQPVMPGGKKRGEFQITGGNLKTGSVTFGRIKPEDEPEKPVMPAPPEVLRKWSAIYDGFGQEAVATNEKGFPLGFKLEKKPTLHGKGISDLAADEQKRLGTMATELMTIARDMRMPTPEAKMAAVGVTDPAKMTPQLWTDGWNKVAGPGAADALVMKATELAGFKNLMLDTHVHRPETILEQMGIDIKGMFPGQQAEGARQVSIAGSGQESPDGAPLAAAKTTTVAAGDNGTVIDQVRRSIETEKDPAIRAKQEAKLKFLEANRAKDGAGPERDAAGFIVKKKEAQTTPYEQKRQAANVQWEDSKKALSDALKDTVDIDEFKLLREGAKTGGDPSMGIPSSGASADDVRQKWVDENAEVLAAKGIKTKDGKPPKLDSVIFVDNTGRSIKLREVLDQMFKDERYGQPEKQIRPSEGKSAAGNQFAVTVGKTKEVK